MPVKFTRPTPRQLLKAKQVGAEIATHLLQEDLRYGRRPSANFYRSEHFRRAISVQFMLAVVGEVFGKALAAGYQTPEESKRLASLQEAALEAAAEAAEKFLREHDL